MTKANDLKFDNLSWSSEVNDQQDETSQKNVVNHATAKSKKSKISRTQTKKERDVFDAPDSILPNKDFDNQITPQKDSRFVLVTNEKEGTKKSQGGLHTQLKTMDTLNRNSTMKGGQFNIEISPTRKFENKFNSNMKETLNNNLFDQEVKQQLHFTNHKDMNLMRSEQADSTQVNAQSKRGPNRGTQMSISKISVQEKEQINQKNEEMIRVMTEQVIARTMN